MIQQLDTKEADERKGLPSASSMQRIMNCPASLPLTHRLRELGQLPTDHGSEDASRGTRIHDYLQALGEGAETLPSGLTQEELEEALSLWDRAQDVITQLFGEDLAEVDIVVEQRLWLEDALTGDAVFSGRFDLIAMDTDKALILDYKTGFSDVPIAAENWQIMAGAVLFREAFGNGREIYGTILQTGHKAEVSRIETDAIRQAGRLILMRLNEKESDPFTLGFNPSDENCKYCPARLACPRLHYDLKEVTGITNADALISTASTPRLDAFLNQLESIERITKAARKEMAARLERGEEAPNYHLASGPARRKVVDAGKLASALISEGADTSTVLASMSMTVGNAERVLKDATGLKGKALKEKMEALAGDAIEAKEPEPSLKRK